MSGYCETDEDGGATVSEEKGMGGGAMDRVVAEIGNAKVRNSRRPLPRDSKGRCKPKSQTRSELVGYCLTEDGVEVVKLVP